MRAPVLTIAHHGMVRVRHLKCQNSICRPGHLSNGPLAVVLTLYSRYGDAKLRDIDSPGPDLRNAPIFTALPAASDRSPNRPSTKSLHCHVAPWIADLWAFAAIYSIGAIWEIGLFGKSEDLGNRMNCCQYRRNAHE